MQRDNVDFYNFYTFIKVECQKNSDVVENVLRCVLSNELFIKVVLLLLVLWVTYHRGQNVHSNSVKWALDTKLLLQNFLQKCLRPK